MTFRSIPNWVPLPPPTAAQPGGLALGTLTMSALGDAGILATGQRWVYAPGISRDEFPPHRALAGTFHDTLPTGDGWYPSDHRGCLCTAEPVLRSPDGRFVSPDVLNPPGRLDRG